MSLKINNLFHQAAAYGKYLLKAKPLSDISDVELMHKLRMVLDENRAYYSFIALDVVRKKNLLDQRILNVNDLGAGSKKSKSNQRTVKSIAQSAVKRKKYAELMFRLVETFELKTIVELGTSLGITTGYLAKGNKNAKVYTFEGSREIAGVARENLNLMKATNVKQIEGDFDETLPEFLKLIDSIDLAFLDGNHRKEPTLKYFNLILPKLTDNSIVVIDDINWSSEMNEAWHELINRPEVTLSIDLFEMGILFFKKIKNTGNQVVKY